MRRLSVIGGTTVLLWLSALAAGCTGDTKALRESQAARIQDLVRERDEERTRATDLRRALDQSKEDAGRLEREKSEALARVASVSKERDDALARTTIVPPVPTPWPGSASGIATRHLYANSLCQYPMRILVHHRDGQSPHHTHAWYSFRPYQESRLEASGVVLKQIEGEGLFAYAETVSGNGVPSLVWTGSDGRTTVDGVTYNLRRLNLTANSRGELEFKFSCSNQGASGVAMHPRVVTTAAWRP